MNMVFPQVPTGLDYDEYGCKLAMCPNCGSVDNIQLRELRGIYQKQVMLNSVFSNHLRREVVYHLLSNKIFKEDSERKMFIANTVKEAKNSTDNYACMTIATAFNMSPMKVLNTFIQLFRATKHNFREYTISNKIL